MSTLDGDYNAAVTADNYVLLYGDWQEAYVVADRIWASLEIIPHLFGPNGRPTGEWGAWLYARVGADVIVPEAGRVLNVATTA